MGWGRTSKRFTFLERSLHYLDFFTQHQEILKDAAPCSLQLHCWRPRWSPSRHLYVPGIRKEERAQSFSLLRKSPCSCWATLPLISHCSELVTWLHVAVREAGVQSLFWSAVPSKNVISVKEAEKLMWEISSDCLILFIYFYHSTFQTVLEMARSLLSSVMGQ